MFFESQWSLLHFLKQRLILKECERKIKDVSNVNTRGEKLEQNINNKIKATVLITGRKLDCCCHKNNMT